MEEDQDGGASSVLLAGESITIDSLLARCHNLLDEIQQFRDFLAQHRKDKDVDVRHFQNGILSEQKSLEKFVATNPNNERTIHTLRSSNLRFYSAVWDAAKQTTGLVTFNKRFYWDNSTSRDLKRQGRPKKRGALVDIVAEDGQQWIKVSTVTEKRLLFELAKQGWEVGSSSDDDEKNEGSITPTSSNGVLNSFSKPNHTSDDEDDKLELIRLAQDLQKASQATRVRYKHPHVHFVLPNVIPGRVAEIDRILSTIHSTGASTSCKPDLNPPQSSSLHSTFAPMLPFSTRQLSSTLNIDCTILLALVSDLSHYTSSSIPLETASGAKSGTPHPASVRQLKMESEEQLLPSILYPLLQGKKL
ncbi:MAG: hypothetical protein Q9191_008373, partial [Dirinaria sp. TL-2023a]